MTGRLPPCIVDVGTGYVKAWAGRDGREVGVDSILRGFPYQCLSAGVEAEGDGSIQDTYNISVLPLLHNGACVVSDEWGWCT